MLKVFLAINIFIGFPFFTKFKRTTPSPFTVGTFCCTIRIFAFGIAVGGFAPFGALSIFASSLASAIIAFGIAVGGFTPFGAFSPGSCLLPVSVISPRFTVGYFTACITFD